LLEICHTQLLKRLYILAITAVAGYCSSPPCYLADFKETASASSCHFYEGAVAGYWKQNAFSPPSTTAGEFVLSLQGC